MKKNIIAIIICILISYGMYYFLLPALNLTDPAFWSFLITNVMLWTFIITTVNIKNGPELIKNGEEFMQTGKIKKFKMPKALSAIIVCVFLIPAIIVVINIAFSPVFNAKSYHERIEVTDGDFKEDIKPVDFNKLALLDKASSVKLGDKVMGQMTDLVSQYEVSYQYTQVSANNKIQRVTPLEYASVIKYFTNRKDGVVGYITVDSVSGESNLVRLDKGMKIMPSALFNEDLARNLRFKYPTKIFENVNFEIDDEGNPYWIVQTIKYKGVGLKKEVSGVVVLDPITGDSKYYAAEKAPKWIDHVYNSDLVIEQLDHWGIYKNGFFNSIFGQKEVTVTTAGYNYLEMDGDIYMYTGITSVASDESNIGFVYTNLRTKETHFYNEPGAEEFSAMSSAEGQVQQMEYVSTFPLLVNLNNKPTYIVSLKDNAGLVKTYAFIDYKDYQKVVTTDSAKGIEAAAESYLGDSIDISESLTKTIKIDEIKTSVVSGNTYYYIKSDKDVYKVKTKTNESIVPFLKVGQEIEITYKEGTIKNIVKIK